MAIRKLFRVFSSRMERFFGRRDKCAFQVFLLYMFTAFVIFYSMSGGDERSYVLNQVNINIFNENFHVHSARNSVMGVNWTWNQMMNILEHFPGRGDFLPTDANGPSVLYPNRSKLPELINGELKVIVLMHSHNDPGYRHTLEDYYNIRAKHVLTIAVEKLMKYKDLTFIWTDTCFLERWWRDQNNKTRNNLRSLVQSGRFEIALGAWVSADECISHYFAYIDQLIEGYYWIREHLEVFPNVSFNMDQFGASASVNYLRSIAGVKISFVNHLHKGTKKYFRKHRLLEFTNRQLSDDTGKDDTFIHIEPFDDLSFKGSCGPSKMVCFGLDLRTFKLPRPDQISFNLPKFLNGMPFWSIHQFAKHLVSQMRIKADGYLHNVLLLPLGNDILYHTEPEWENEYRNLKILMKYINSHESFKVNMKFGTVHEYYDEIMKATNKHQIKYALGAGDFLPYTRGPKYWSGYFTTRQFMKRLGRELQESVRATDLLMAFMFQTDFDLIKQIPDYKVILSKLIYSRQQVYIFQHHDAITGTAEEIAVIDYKRRLSSALISSQEVMSYFLKLALQRQLNTNDLNCRGAISIHSTVVRTDVDQLTKQAVIEVESIPTTLIVFNSYTRNRTDLLNVVLKTKNSVIVTGPNDSVVDFDIEQSKDVWKLHFIAELPPVSVSVFTIVSNTVVPTLKPEKTGNYFHCENSDMKMTFSLAEGTPLSICNGNICTDFQIDLLHYTPISDAYTFPDSRKYRIIRDYSKHIVFNGKTFCSVEFFYGYIKVKYVLQKVKGLNGRRLQMNIHDNLSKSASNNFEGQFAVRVKTSIQNGRTYYTDSNGLQLMKRKYRSHLSFGSNVYPVTSTAVIQDKSKRLTVHSVQPNAAVSRESGSLDIMVDRVVTRENDGTVRRFKGDTKDNLPTSTHFFFQLEESSPPLSGDASEMLKPSLNSVLTNDLVQHPVHVFFSNDKFTCNQNIQSFLNNNLPSEMVIANLKCLIGEDYNLQGLSLSLLRRDVISDIKSMEFNPTSIFRNCSRTLYNMFQNDNKYTDNFAFNPLDLKTFLIK